MVTQRLGLIERDPDREVDPVGNTESSVLFFLQQLPLAQSLHAPAGT